MSHWTALVDPQTVIPSEVREVAHRSPLDEPGVKAKPVKATPRKRAPKRPPKNTRSQYNANRWEGSLQRQLMQMLQPGSFEEGEFRKEARGVAQSMGFASKWSVTKALHILVKRGLVVAEFRLTEEGRKELGLETIP